MTNIDDADVQALASLLKMTIEHAFAGQRHALALGELLIEKGVVTEEEIAAKIRSTDEKTGEILRLLEAFVNQFGKPS